MLVQVIVPGPDQARARTIASTVQYSG